MKIWFLTSLFSIILLLFTTCDTSHYLEKVAQNTNLAPYDGSNSFQVSLIDKVAVEFDPTHYFEDTKLVNKESVFSLITNEWERDYLNFFYLHKDSTAIATNLQYHLLAKLSNSRIHEKIDSLKVYIVEVEMIIPYHENGYVTADSRSRSLGNPNFIGPSRVRLQVIYQCYHNNLVTENLKIIQRTLSSHHQQNTGGGEKQMIETHITAAYTLINELLAETSQVIKGELEDEM